MKGVMLLEGNANCTWCLKPLLEDRRQVFGTLKKVATSRRHGKVLQTSTFLKK